MSIKCVLVLALISMFADLPRSFGEPVVKSSQFYKKTSVNFPLSMHSQREGLNRYIVDSQNRQVILRGVNINSLGDYWEAVAGEPTVLETTERDFAMMSALGMNVVRLVVSWSKIQPERERYDQDYLDSIRKYIKRASRFGIYTIIDMHQDAYSKYIYTDIDREECARPAKGWDGAPRWATLTDSGSTCLRGGERNSSEAVRNSWKNFYMNKDGIRDEFARMWGFVARTFSQYKEVVGYDLLNEPESIAEMSIGRFGMQRAYNDLIRETVESIRHHEHSGEPKLIMIESALPSYTREFLDFITPRFPHDANLVYSGHTYPTSHGALSSNLQNIYWSFNALMSKAPLWIGEFGTWGTGKEDMDKMRAFALDEDKRRIGGAWWQWRQPCGEPHTVRFMNDRWTIASKVTQLIEVHCPGNTDQTLIREFADLVRRGYPRSTPGRIQDFWSDPESFSMSMKVKAAESDIGHELVVWTPTTDETHKIVTTGGLGKIRESLVAFDEIPWLQGRLLRVDVKDAGRYSLKIIPRKM